MLPPAYGLPVSVLLVAGGGVACFAGYRLFRIVLGIYGFILGATLASSVMGANSATGMVVAAIVGGLAGSLVMVMAYFVGIALVGAGLGAFIGHTMWAQVGTGDPSIVIVAGTALAGGAAAMLLQRHVIITATALAGAWTMIIGVLNILALRGIAQGASATEVWILYPTPASDVPWVPYAWVGLSVVGIAVQLGLTKSKKK